MKKVFFYFSSLLIFFILTAYIIEDDIKGKIVCFGDSITNGAMVEENSWVIQLDKKSASVSAVNAGRNGRKTSDKYELLPVLENNKDADYFLLLLGVNDLKNGNDSMVAECVKNMNWMINEIKEKIPSAEIVLMSPCDINLEDMSELNKGKKYNKNTASSLIKLEKEYQDLAEKQSIGFISLLHTVSPENFIDGIHPDKNGYKEIADKVWKELNKIY